MPEKKTKQVKLADVNPQVKSVKIGIQHLRKVSIFPLSVADQLNMTDLITDAVGQFFAMEAEKAVEGPPVEFIVFMLELLKSNIGELVTKITAEDDSDKVLSEMTNDQLSNVVEIVYRENFERPLAKIVGLFQKDQTETAELILEKLQQQSAGPTVDTDSNTSSEEATGKEE